jgi:DNA-binding CsgD family transcriptional regulator
MTATATVLFADVVASRRDPSGSAARLRHLASDLDAAYGPDRLAPFGFTQGDELQGLLAMSADPVQAVVRAALDPAAPRLRWAIVVGPIDDGVGPATERTGAAFLAARQALAEARSRRVGMILRTGDAGADSMADDLTPLLVELLGRLTRRQREIGRLFLVEGLRQVDVARRLRISRAAVSIAVSRAFIPSIGRLARAIGRVYVAGVEAASADRAATTAAVAPPAGAPADHPERSPDR